ncbi:uncharacterized protein DSM5745_01079 [Aspergillus mulundensis]|uniref:Exonuclease domain-containing protein n=1 Tax=Aspergillus mulundensis TaxID=1810919 RepID=A0A3D8T5B6_9EURO|nr:hypothetical protein DSM5745_01079 [Aspergillus mulundensis]RDW93757.1 hypothetical protein DSM5745_01079 [Aspergillus mulundensis]
MEPTQRPTLPGPAPAIFKCLACGKNRFKSAEALAEHQLAVGHRPGAPERHDRSKPGKPSASAESKSETVAEPRLNTQTRQAHLVPLAIDRDLRLGRSTHGPEFIVLSDEQMFLVSERLLASCHSAARLQVQRYRMTVEPPEKKPRPSKKQLEKDTKAPGETNGVGGRFGEEVLLGQNQSNRDKQPEKVSENSHSDLISIADNSNAQEEQLRDHGQLEKGTPSNEANKASTPRQINIVDEKTPDGKAQSHGQPPQKKSSEDKTKSGKSSKRPCEPILFIHTPKFLDTKPYGIRKAIALDCEMVGVEGHQDQLAFLSAVDFFTGEVLINNYVQPTKRVIDWRTRVSGVTSAAMSAAVRSGQALFGWQAAQHALWRYADADTVLVGHSLDNDLKVLRIIHPTVVDSAILSAEPVFNPEPNAPIRRIWALKKVAKIFLGRDIQTGGKKGHNCLEDAYAARDVVIWCLLNPDRLAAWAKIAREEYELKMEQIREAREQAKREEEAKKHEKTKKQEEKNKQEENMLDLAQDRGELEMEGHAHSSLRTVLEDTAICQELDARESDGPLSGCPVITEDALVDGCIMK